RDLGADPPLGHLRGSGLGGEPRRLGPEGPAHERALLLGGGGLRQLGPERRLMARQLAVARSPEPRPVLPPRQNPRASSLAPFPNCRPSLRPSARHPATAVANPLYCVFSGATLSITVASKFPTTAEQPHAPVPRPAAVPAAGPRQRQRIPQPCQRG